MKEFGQLSFPNTGKEKIAVIHEACSLISYPLLGVSEPNGEYHSRCD